MTTATLNRLTDDERTRVARAEQEARHRALLEVEADRAASRLHLDETDAVEAWTFCWPFLDLADVATPDDMADPPYPHLRLSPRRAVLDNAARGFIGPGSLWKAHHDLTGYPGAPAALEGYQTLPAPASDDFFGMWVRIALWGEVEQFRAPAQQGRMVTMHGAGAVRTGDVPEGAPQWRGTWARVTGFSLQGQHFGGRNVVYLHQTHGWFKTDDGWRKYPTTERLRDREWLTGEFAQVWAVPVV